MTTTKPNYTREMPDQTKRKISQTMLGKNMQRSPETRRKISDGLKRAWQQIPPKTSIDNLK